MYRRLLLSRKSYRRTFLRVQKHPIRLAPFSKIVQLTLKERCIAFVGDSKEDFHIIGIYDFWSVQLEINVIEIQQEY